MGVKNEKGERVRSVAEWCRLDGEVYQTVIKRRIAADVGFQVPPNIWMLTQKEWETVKATPIPGSKSIRGRRRK